MFGCTKINLNMKLLDRFDWKKNADLWDVLFLAPWTAHM